MTNKHLTLTEACVYLGVSPWHLYRLTSTNRIPHYKPTGKKIYFDKAELDEWLRQKKVKTHSELKKEAQGRMLRRSKPRNS